MMQSDNQDVGQRPKIGSLSQFMPLLQKEHPHHKLKTEAKQSARDSNSVKPNNNRNRFSAIDQIVASQKKTGNPLLKVVKSRSKRGGSLGDSFVAKHTTSKVQSSVSKVLNKTDNYFFVKKDSSNVQVLEKEKLSRQHHLLKSIIKTREYQNKYKGTDLYDDSFKRLYVGLKKIEVNPLIDKRVAELSQQQESLQLNLKKMDQSAQVFQKEKRLRPQLRLRLENCRSWARKHHKVTSFYQRQLQGAQKQVSNNLQQRGEIIGDIKRLLKI